MVNWLSESIASRIVFHVGELTAEPLAEGWLLRGPRSDAPERELDPSPPQLRRWTRFDDSCRYRPLSGARGLPTSWQTRLPSADALADAIEAIYPLATRHIAQAASGGLRTVSLEAVLERQSGRYESSSSLTADGRAAAIEVVCGSCVRTPAWMGGSAAPVGGAIPCPEPCGVMVSFCRDATTWEQECPSPAPVNPSVAFADFESPGNELREAWLSHRLATTSGGVR